MTRDVNKIKMMVRLQKKKKVLPREVNSDSIPTSISNNDSYAVTYPEEFWIWKI